MARAVELAPVLRDLQQQGLSPRGMSAELMTPGSAPSRIACTVSSSNSINTLTYTARSGAALDGKTPDKDARLGPRSPRGEV
jgi:hypothetical protein